jgi:hypothetical protein
MFRSSPDGISSPVKSLAFRGLPSGGASGAYFRMAEQHEGDVRRS